MANHGVGTVPREMLAGLTSLNTGAARRKKTGQYRTQKREKTLGMQLRSFKLPREPFRNEGHKARSKQLQIWGGRRESNPQPSEPQSGALPVELLPPESFDYNKLEAA